MKGIKKIFIGLSDSASLIHDYTVGFNALGLDVFSVVHKQSPLQSSKCDVVIEKLIQEHNSMNFQEGTNEYNLLNYKILDLVFKKAIKECDIFFFIFHTFMPDFSDLAKLKSLGKKVIFQFVGSDCRWANAFNQDVTRYGLRELPPGCNNKLAEFPNTLLRLRSVEQFADVIFNTPSQAGLALRPYYNCLAYPMDSSLFVPDCCQKEVPVVLHAPSSRAHKSSDQVEHILQRLQSEGLKFIPKIIEKMPRHKAIEAYSEVDILAGQMGIICGGRQERELLACGKVVVGAIKPEEYPQMLPADYPAIRAHTPEEMYQALKAIIPDLPRRQALASQGPAYVQANHNPAKTCLKYLKALSGQLEPDFTPDFFRNVYLPEEELIPTYNAATKLVTNCLWYERHVPRGTRNGLVF